MMIWLFAVAKHRTALLVVGTLLAGLGTSTITRADPAIDFSKVRQPFVITGDWKSNDFTIDVPPDGSFMLLGKFMNHSVTQADTPFVWRQVAVRKRLQVQMTNDNNGPVTLIYIDRGPNVNRSGRTTQLFMLRPPATFQSSSNWLRIRAAIAERMQQLGQPVAD